MNGKGRPRAAALLLALAASASPGHGATRPEPWLEERAAALGVDFTHHSGRSGRYLTPEIMGPGVAMLDADGDGDLDLFFVDGGSFDPSLDRKATAPSSRPRLFRNQVVESGALRFVDVTEASGLAPCAYGMGAAAGDYDNDGRVDLYVTCVGSNQLWHNEGPGAGGTPRFRDVTTAAHADDPRWSVAATFFDFDGDGWLDLYVGNYLRFSAADAKPCALRTGEPDWCGPVPRDAVPGRLLHNRRDGTFEDVTQASGLAARYGPGLGARAFDFDGDGWLDLYVANDETENQLWINRHDGTFADQGVVSGCALSGEGQAQASMGIDAGDYDGDGDLDVAIANLAGEGIVLYRTERAGAAAGATGGQPPAAGGGFCEDVGLGSGLRAGSLATTGFGLGWVDLDGDGWLDLVVVNGAIKSIEAQRRGGGALPLRQPRQIFHNLGNGRFEDASVRGGDAFLAPEVSRGAAFGDLDNDGDTDVVVATVDGPARIFLGQAAARGPWVGVRLQTIGGGDALGALVTLERASGPVLVRSAHADGSYASANDPRVLFALGAGAPPRRVVVRWPSGRSESFAGPQAGRYTTLREGSGSKP